MNRGVQIHEYCENSHSAQSTEKCNIAHIQKRSLISTTAALDQQLNFAGFGLTWCLYVYFCYILIPLILKTCISYIFKPLQQISFSLMFMYDFHFAMLRFMLYDLLFDWEQLL